MKKINLVFVCVAAVALCLAACGWKPSVTAVPITAPWSAMNLPVKENAVVWSSTPTEFKAVHKEDKKAVMGKYVDALKGQGWTMEKFDDTTLKHAYDVVMAKGTEKLEIEFYDFENTGVIINKK